MSTSLSIIKLLLSHSPPRGSQITFLSQADTTSVISMRAPSPSPHLWDDKLPGNKQRPQQVVSAVISHFIDGYLKTKRIFEGEIRTSVKPRRRVFPDGRARFYLRAGQDDWLAQIFAHEGQGGGRVRHRVRAVEDHKSIVVLIVILRTDKKKS